MHGRVNGFYDGETRTIHISPNATDPLGVVLSHEVIHRLKETSPVQYAELERLALQQLQHANALDSLVAQVRAAYGNGSQEMILDEVVARYMQNLVTDINEFERLVGINRNLAQKLLDWLDEFLHQARLSLRGLSAKEQKEVFFGLTLDEVEATRKAWAEAVRRADAGAAGQANARMIRLDADGLPYVEITEDILNDVAPREIVKTVNKYLQTRPIHMGGWDVQVNAATRNEYHNSGYTQTVQKEKPQMYADKMRAAHSINEIVQTAEQTINENLKHPRKDRIRSFNRGKIRLQIGENSYIADVVTGITPTGKEILYDIVNIRPFIIKKLPRQILTPQTASSPDIGTAFNINIAQSQTDVNSDSTTKAPNSQAKHSEILQTKATESAPNFQTPSPTHTEQLPTQMERDAEAAVRLGQASQAMQERKKKESENSRSDLAQYVKFQALLSTNAPKFFDDYQNIKYTDAEGWDTLKKQYRRANGQTRSGKSSGQSAASDGGKPQLIGTLAEVTETSAVETLAGYRDELTGLDHEVNISITADGQIWRTVGTADAVNPELVEAEGVSLTGSYSLHNHPAKETFFSFSAQDVGFFIGYQERYSEAFDHLYRYTMRRTAKTVQITYDDAALLFEKIRQTHALQLALEEQINMDADGYHVTMIELAKRLKIEYGREPLD